MENQTIPLWLTDSKHIPRNPWIDRSVFRYLQKRNVPIGIFYRDVYWKFDDLYPLKGWKKRIMKWIYQKEERFYEKYASALFLPSMEMAPYVDIKIPKYALPPGGKEFLPQQNKSHSGLKGLYVGGIAHADYGLNLLLDSFELVKNAGIDYHLTICCREREFQSIKEKDQKRIKELGVEIVHLAGDDLKKLYQEMDFALIPRYRSTYNDFSVPVKLVEYLSYQLPVVATNCQAQASFVRSGPYGVICEDHAESMAEGIIHMKQEKVFYRQEIEASFLQKHSWLSRAKHVAEILEGIQR
jgi:glycosyltransferase involved in cell wall biosynthesis